MQQFASSHARVFSPQHAYQVEDVGLLDLTGLVALTGLIVGLWLDAEQRRDLSHSYVQSLLAGVVVDGIDDPGAFFLARLVPKASW